jgi:uncharacterized MAPEG superfamily protein
MSKELIWLTLTLAATTLFSFPYVLNRIAVRGLWGTMSNPSSSDAPQSPWADRAQRAHSNAIENLVLFAPAAVVVSMINAGNDATHFACQLYFYSRVIHYVVYLAGVPVLRTLAFFGGWAGIAILVYRLLTVTQA